MFRGSRQCLFYQKHQAKGFSNPLRRWVPFYVAGGVVAFTTVWGSVQYLLAWREGKKYGDGSGRYLCGSGMVDALTLLPLNTLSHSAGLLAGDSLFPPSAHQKVISWVAWLWGVPLKEEELRCFSSFQDFYARPWKAEERPVNEAACMVSPCDGEVLSVMEDVRNDTLVQVKGCSYPSYSLFRLSHQPHPAPGMKRVLVVIKLGLRDYHQVIAPCSFQCHGSIYIPGALLPISQAWYHYIPGILTINERVVLHGKAAGSAAPVYMALVGSTLTGKIRIAIDARIKTNFLDPPEYSIFTSYPSTPLLTKGGVVGSFQWGSTVVVMTDVPNSEIVSVKPGALVRAGEALIG